MQLVTILLVAVLGFAGISCIIFIHHEVIAKSHSVGKSSEVGGNKLAKPSFRIEIPKLSEKEIDIPVEHDQKKSVSEVDEEEKEKIEGSKELHFQNEPHLFDKHHNLNNETERKGTLTCKGKQIDSEVIYWKIVPGDKSYESPITPHHGDHHDKYLTFEYDNGGWNNVRMSLECLIVVAHATGRTLVIPPQQHLYLLGKTHKDEHDTKAHDEMGFSDFFEIDVLTSHEGFHAITMNQFLAQEAALDGLNPHRHKLPKNNTNLWGRPLWYYLTKVADATPSWMGKFIAFPANAEDFEFENRSAMPEHTKKRLDTFSGGRPMVVYDKSLRDAHHIHFRGDGEHRVLQHHYAFAFFADPAMQSFYKRFIRDFVRYKDHIQCAGDELVRAVRADSLRTYPGQGGVYYALHVRRGDFQFKEVKISAKEIVANLAKGGPGGTPIIPPGSIVYLSTDDPDGICKDCYVQRKPCTEHKTPKPVGCPEDTSWNAMREYGWNLRFLGDYLKNRTLAGVNPNLHGMIESIVCSRAKVFVGTYFSTFTGYIHRMRGYHGIGEQTYYHHQHYLNYLQKEKSSGNGFSREWRYGWTDDGGELVR